MPAIPATDNIAMIAGTSEFAPLTVWGDGRIDIHEDATAAKLREQAKVIRERSALMYERDAWNEIVRAALLDQTANLLDLRRSQLMYENEGPMVTDEMRAAGLVEVHKNGTLTITPTTEAEHLALGELIRKSRDAKQAPGKPYGFAEWAI
jgi:hypothetical protein